MAKQPDDLTLHILQDIQETLADHTKRFERVDGELHHIKKQISDLSLLVTHSCFIGIA